MFLLFHWVSDLIPEDRSRTSPSAADSSSHTRLFRDVPICCSPSMPQGFGSARSQKVGRFIDRGLCAKEIRNKGLASSTYSLVQVDGVLAGDNVGDGRTGLPALGGLDGAGHF